MGYVSLLKYYLFFLLLTISTIGNCFNSLCADSVTINADKEIHNDVSLNYQGNVVVKSGDLTIKGTSVTAKNISAPFYMENIKFSFIINKDYIYGFSDIVTFYPESCVLELSGNTVVIIDGVSQKYGAIKYFLDKNEIKPLWYYIDQRIRVRP